MEQSDYFTGYAKKADILIYSRLKSLTKTAIENSAWLRMKMAQNLAACDHKIYELNPYTTVDKLVIKLLDLNPVTYGVINETQKISDISITVNAVQHNCGIIKLSVSILNDKNITYLVNNDSGHFYIRDEDQNKFQLALDNPIIIEPSLTQDIILKFEIFSATGTLRFNFSPKPNEILIIALDNVTEL
ncbi:MAG: hypothetical protein EAZ39_20280 [Oscillatoriales cyanobacterium]|uniref:hypothetical protein n=1 Tax=unclassified Microcoleus TaxID=2642155 RepID=UPI001DFF569C|nr:MULTISPECIES: hypothetical protein [unclassified Microcoleus]TAE64447.1 MAG: hypothetical protein EAZ86_26905 [Oscillatoriales cyanobacterium]MCC3436063.1 hypothetical protein [Microcoleus sp. PH2017_05_CCC_O_A]MCC3454089.1 hypothetical protein [Microcoleus sp. PH2017_08_TRC_O_A]MCC3492734.1 hypothetical protein [Microcoleus sp. PH2017_16_JOR_D_A]MCC3585272.1 hypothetical protein [Microcoleus sp. PH2017_30_WIL_O_A]